MEIKQYHIYKMRNDLNKQYNSLAVVIQNDYANKISDIITIILYKNGEFKNIDTVSRDDLIENIGKLTEDECKKAKEYYNSIML